MTVLLNASNPVSNTSCFIKITVVERLYGLYFTANTAYSGTLSASIVNQQAAFLFMLNSGNGYTCAIDYGDGSMQSITDAASNLNNTFIYHIYHSKAIYSVTISCINSVNAIALSVNHNVQYEVTGLSLNPKYSTRFTTYKINFFVATGTNTNIMLYHVRGLDTGITFDTTANAGSSSSYIATSSGLYGVNITAWNLVSSVSLNTFFEIGAPILNPTLMISNNVFSAFIYKYGTSIAYTIDMFDGSNVKLQFFTGEEPQANSSPTYEITLAGDWKGAYTFNYVYVNPGDYSIVVCITNSFGSFNLIKEISVVSDVFNMVLSLLNQVTLTVAGAEAQFIFNYKKSGSHAQITFWPGDSANISFGPYDLGMDFNNNINKNPIGYTYQQLGMYTFTILVQNIISSKYYALSFNVTLGVSGVYINAPLYVATGSTFSIETYLLYGGSNASYKWNFDGTIVNANRKGIITY